MLLGVANGVVGMRFAEQPADDPLVERAMRLIESMGNVSGALQMPIKTALDPLDRKASKPSAIQKWLPRG